MLIETLESRRLLSVSLGSGGTLTVVGTDGWDNILVTVVDGQYRVTLNGRTTAYAASKVQRIVADARNGADTIRLTEAVKVPSTLNPGSGERFDSQPDNVYGGGGDDYIIGNARSYELRGGGGNDVIEGRGESAAYGDDGDDRITWFSGADHRVEGGAGTDTFDDSHSNGGSLDSGGDILGNDADVYAAGYFTSNDSYKGIDNWVGSSYGDIIIGSSIRNVLRGGGGDDLLMGMNGDDELYGGAGNDTLRGGSGRDALFGGDGNDLLYAQDGTRDFLSGGNGTDKARRDAIDEVLGIEGTAP
ncbi:MAG TPA: hypothetical protein VF796_07915 [Humisphaera sp.]